MTSVNGPATFATTPKVRRCFGGNRKPLLGGFLTPERVWMALSEEDFLSGARQSPSVLG